MNITVPTVAQRSMEMPEEFEHELIGVLQEHYGKNFDYNWDSEEDGFYIRLRVWKEEADE